MKNTDSLSRRSFWLCCLLWTAMVAVFFAPAIFGGKVLAPMDIMECLISPYATQPMENVHNHFTVDAISQYLPYNYSVAESFRQDGYMGWNPYAHNGTPIAENTMLCPGDWHHALYFFLPFWTAWDTGIILQFFIAGLGMIAFLRNRKVPAPYCLLGAAGYGFYSQFVMWIYHRWVLGTMCWAPWILWALMRNREKRIIDLPSILFIALGFRGGHLQACLFIVLLTGCVWLADWWSSPSRWNLKTLWRVSLPYLVSGIGGALLSIDVLAQTIPPLMAGVKELPSLVTVLFPTLLGVPETIDLFKLMGQDLFDLKFTGGVIFVLSVLGLFNRKAPLTAKFLMVISLALVFTPLITYFYSRSTAVYALGASWLAAWQLHALTQEPARTVWKKIFIALGVLTLGWLLCSVLIQIFHQDLLSMLQRNLLSRLSAAETGRENWYLLRTERLLEQSCIWYPRTLALLALLWGGLWAASRIHVRARHKLLLASLVILCSLGELLLVQATWVQYADKPESAGLYKEPEWMPRLKQQVGDGSVSFYSTQGDKDYLHANHLSTFGIKLAEGYETVAPRRLHSLQDKLAHPEAAARAGISHIIVNPRHSLPQTKGWDLVENNSRYILLANPDYKGRYFAANHATGESAPVQPGRITYNQMDFTVPPGTTALDVLESYSDGWTARINGGKPVPVECTENYGITVPLAATDTPAHVLLQYRDHRQDTYYGIILATLLLICGASLWRHMKKMPSTPH
jgi:hypothetical protein